MTPKMQKKITVEKKFEALLGKARMCKGFHAFTVS